MSIQVRCGCGREFSVKAEFAGRTGKCPGCGKGVTVPRAAASEDDGLLPIDLPPPPARREAGCHAHPMLPPKGACATCAKLLCVRCVCEVEGATYCQSCMTAAGTFRGGAHEERAEGLVTKSYKAYFNASRPIAALGSARLTVMNGWVLWALMVGLSFFLYYMQPIAAHYTESSLIPLAIGVVQLFALLFLECAFVACIRDALFQKEFGIGRFFHYGARYFLRYFLCALAFWGVLIAAFVALGLQVFFAGGGSVTSLLAFLVGLIGINILFSYARILVVLEDAGPFEALRRSVAFGISHWGKVLVLALLCGCAGGLILVKGTGIFFFLPSWVSILVRNLFVFLAIGTQIAAGMVLYLSLLPDEDAFRKVLPPEDVPETNGPLALKVSIGAFVGVMGLAYWASHLAEVEGPTTVLNELGEAILKAARPKAKLVWKLDSKEPVLAGPVAVGADVLVCFKDRMERRKVADGSLVWMAALPGRAATPPVRDGERAYVVCLSMGPKTEEFPYGEPIHTLVAVSLSDGAAAWTARLPRASGAWPQPEVAKGLVIVPSQYRMHAFSKTDGAEVWATAEGGMMLAIGPARAADDGIYYAAQDDLIHVVDPADGHELRTMSNPALSLFRKPVVTADSVYTTAANTVIRFERKTGRRPWEHNLGRDEMNADSMRIEVIDGVPLYHFAAQLRTLDPKTGAMGWMLDTGGQLVDTDREGRQILTENFLAEGYAIDGTSLVVIANDGAMMGRVDIRTGKRSDHADLPVDPRQDWGEGEEDNEEALLDFVELGGLGDNGDPVIIGRVLVFVVRGKLYAVELP